MKTRTVWNREDYNEDYWRETLECNGEEAGDYGYEEMQMMAEEAYERLEEELEGLRAYLSDDGESWLHSAKSPTHGNHLLARGGIGRWDGTRYGLTVFETIDDLLYGRQTPFRDCEIDSIEEDAENGSLFIHGSHHDGSVFIEIRQLSEAGEAVYGELGEDESIIDPVTLFDAHTKRNERTFYPGQEGDMFRTMWDNREYCRRPDYMKRAFRI